MNNCEEIRLLKILKDNLHLEMCMCLVVHRLENDNKISYDEADTLLALIENDLPTKRYDVESVFYFPPGHRRPREIWCDELINKLNN